LRKDYTTPQVFAEAFNSVLRMKTREAQEESVTSLGPEWAGLPFHTHGPTWIGLVHGAKMWFLYAPGEIPGEVYRQSALRSTKAWFQIQGRDLMKGSTGSREDPAKMRVSQLRKRAAAFGMTSDQMDAADDSGNPKDAFIAFIETRKEPEHHKEPSVKPPLFCVQREGDVLYLPFDWHHATMNLCETLAIGGQNNLARPESLSKYKKSVKTLAMQGSSPDVPHEVKIRHMRNALKIEPYNIELLINIADFHRNVGDTKLATETVREAVNVLEAAAEKGHVESSQSLATHYERLGSLLINVYDDLVGGRKLLDRCLAIQPSNTAALHNRAYSQLMSGDHDTAIDTLAQVLKIDPNHVHSKPAYDSLTHQRQQVRRA